MLILLGFWSYLWGIETIFSKSIYMTTRWFWSYLWGIETLFGERKFFQLFQVLILPMRDWNIFTKTSIVLPFFCFDLTYEGVKLWWIQRNRRTWRTFWSYLWGIEIPRLYTRQSDDERFDLTYEGLKLIIGFFCIGSPPGFDLTYEGLKSKALCSPIPPSKVLILPMRDWNPSMPISFKALLISFWSYLWGIEMYLI